MVVATFDWHIFLVLLIILALIALDFLVGVFSSIAGRTFNLQKLPAQLANFVLPYFGPLLILAILQFLSPLLKTAGVTGVVDGVFYTAAATVGMKAVQDIIAKLGMFGTLPLIARPNEAQSGTPRAATVATAVVPVVVARPGATAVVVPGTRVDVPPPVGP